MNSDSDPPVSTDQEVTETPPEGTCPRCDRKLPADSPSQLCPYCLLAAETGDPTSPWTGGLPIEVPEPTELQPFFEALEIRSLIGRGGMGAVYRAHQPSLGRDVALKILLPEIAATEGFTDRFLREARALARLGHPNVVAVYDHGTAGPYAFLVMELVEGINLRELMAGDRLPPEEALRIVPQLCDALQFAHARGVVHRDIKPENILIDEAGGVKITDFGLAKLGESDDKLGRTGTRQVMGTVHYMAPEQIERPREVDHRADLYSLGVVFYELLTGELPLGRFSPPSKKAGTNRQVDHVVLKSLEKEPDKRYSSAEEVRSDLDRGAPLSQQARAAAGAVDQKVRQATGAVRSAASGIGQSWNSWATLAATVLFYAAAVFAVMIVVNNRDPGVPFVVTVVCIWVFAYFLDRLYRSTPLPNVVSPAGLPVIGIAGLPRHIYGLFRDGAESIQGLRMGWMIAAVTAFAIAIGCIVAAIAVNDDVFAGVFIAAPAAWFLMRMALPKGQSPQTLSARMLTYPPVLLPLVPIACVFLIWPAILWIAMIAHAPPGWFSSLTGITEHVDEARYSQNVAQMRAQLFGGLSIEFGWLTMLALVGAVFPEAVRWIARPVMDDWSGRGRWLLLLGCIILFALSALLWSV